MKKNAISTEKNKAEVIPNLQETINSMKACSNGTTNTRVKADTYKYCSTKFI